MDPVKKSTLDLIESVVLKITPSEAGKQLLLVAYEYVEDDDIKYAKAILSKIETSYYTDYAPLHAVQDQDFAIALARLIEFFGPDLGILNRKAGES